MKHFILIIPFLLMSCASQNDVHYEMWKPSLVQLDPTSKKYIIEGKSYSLKEDKPEIITISKKNPVYEGVQFLDYTEKENRSELKSLTGVDPVRIEWCAAFANAILEKSNIKSNKDHRYALTARSFLDWGTSVEEPEMGDIVVFPRGDVSWQGHVGFFVKQQVIDDELYYYILGGNQKNSVNVTLFPASKAIDIRRHVELTSDTSKK
jgi:uncharacterized protein (TIGR02594 family)